MLKNLWEDILILSYQTDDDPNFTIRLLDNFVLFIVFTI